jgi:2-oxoglutarate dehydrogenase E2 component (dihydrolipoamide succinyltransferase)
MPTDQTEGTTNTVGKWFRNVGDLVRENDPLLEITTDKVTVEIAAPAAGVLVEILKAEGDAVEPGEILGRVGAGMTSGASATAKAAPPTEAAKPAATEGGAETELSPAVRRMLKEHNVDASGITGTGRGGRITTQDVEAFLASGSGSAPAAPSGIPSRRVPHTSMRKSIAEHMAKSVATAPHVTSVFQADLSAIIAHGNNHKAAFAEKGVKLTYTAYFIRAAAEALQAVPEVNSRWHDDALEIFEDANIGIGTALEGGGLIVPVVHQAQTLDLLGTATRLHDLISRAREKKLEPKDVQHGTFTISNHGVSGSLIAAPIIINQPQSAILGVGKLERRPVANSRGEITVRPMAYVTLTIDHRVLDGFQANAFLTKWVGVIEEWRT